MGENQLANKPEVGVLERTFSADTVDSGSSMELPGVRLHYRWDGEPGRPVLLLSNSLGTNLTMWEPQIAAFARRFRVLRYDARGHGRSSVPQGPYSMEMLGRDALALLDGLGVERCRFCGLSMGGMVGQWLGVHAPDRVTRLILCNTAPRIGTAEGWNARIAEVLREGVAAVSGGVLERWYTAEFRRDHPEVAAATRQMLDATDRAGYAASCAAVRDLDLREAVRCMGVPTLIVSGARDPVTPAAEARELAAAIPGARYVELEAAHLSNVEAAHALNAAVLEFLDS